jgi:hypothetical protein
VQRQALELAGELGVEPAAPLLRSAARACAAALARAAETGNPPSRQAALLFGALLALELRDPASVRAYGTELVARPSDLALPTRVAADALAGYLQVLDGQTAAGIDRILAAAPGDPGEDEHAPPACTPWWPGCC